MLKRSWVKRLTFRLIVCASLWLCSIKLLWFLTISYDKSRRSCLIWNPFAIRRQHYVIKRFKKLLSVLNHLVVRSGCHRFWSPISSQYVQRTIWDGSVSFRAKSFSFLDLPPKSREIGRDPSKSQNHHIGPPIDGICYLKIAFCDLCKYLEICPS